MDTTQDQKYWNMINKWRRQANDLAKIAAGGCDSQPYVRVALEQAKVYRQCAFELEALITPIEEITNG